MFQKNFPQVQAIYFATTPGNQLCYEEHEEMDKIVIIRDITFQFHLSSPFLVHIFNSKKFSFIIQMMLVNIYNKSEIDVIKACNKSSL